MDERAPRYYMSDRDADRSCLHKIKTTTEQSPLVMDKISFIVCSVQRKSLDPIKIIYRKDVLLKVCQRQSSVLLKVIICSDILDYA